MPAQTVIKLRRGTATQWVSANPILAAGEAGVETDTNQLKIGDGIDSWNSLPYITGGSGAATIVSETEPAATIEGGLWYKASTQRLYIYIDGTGWSLVPTEGIIAQDTEPGNTDILWLDTDEPGDAVLPLAGTTGQVLQKIDGADYNTEWATLTTSDVSDLTATASAINTIDDGTAGYTALSNGTAGLSYQPVSHNYIINGAFDIWQRGTAGTATDDYVSVDRWTTRRSVSVDKSTDVPSDQFEYSADVTSEDTANFSGIQTRLESSQVRQLAGQTVTYSFYVKANSDAINNSARFVIRSANSKDDFSSDTLEGLALLSGDVSPDTWTRLSLTLVLSNNAKNGLLLQALSQGVYSSGTSNMKVTGVQLEAGSVATPFKRNANSIAGELAACQRYYYALANDENQSLGVGVYSGTAQIRFHVPFPVAMRSNPSLEVTSGTDYYQLIPGNDTVDDFFILNAHATGAELSNNTDASGTTGEAGIIRTSNSSAFIAFDAEL